MCACTRECVSVCACMCECMHARNLRGMSSLMLERAREGKRVEHVEHDEKMHYSNDEQLEGRIERR
eukprot:6190061-Pleurochrysis_carterae.AAC.1